MEIGDAAMAEDAADADSKMAMVLCADLGDVFVGSY